MIYLPYPPTINQLFAGKARRFKSGKYKAWCNEAEIALQGQSFKFWGDIPLKVELAIQKPLDKRKRDLDNLIKAPFDMLTGKAWIDDSQVVEIKVYWAHCQKFEGVKVKIKGA